MSLNLSWKNVSAYLMTSTSIIGAAVATPAFVGALTHTITWKEAALPLLGAVISFVIPQKLSPPASGAVVVAAAGSTIDALAQAAAASPNAVVREVASVAPEVVEELEHAFAAYQGAAARLDAAKSAAVAQNVKLGTVIAKTTAAVATPAPAVAQAVAVAQQNPALAQTNAVYTP